jgi:DNA-binding XRE family transcriptional regulator
MVKPSRRTHERIIKSPNSAHCWGFFASPSWGFVTAQRAKELYMERTTWAKVKKPLKPSVKSVRERAGLSQLEFSKIAGIQQTLVSDYETGKRKPSNATDIGALNFVTWLWIRGELEEYLNWLDTPEM